MQNILLVTTSKNLAGLFETEAFNEKFAVVQTVKSLDDAVLAFANSSKTFHLCVITAEVKSTQGDTMMSAISKMRSSAPEVRIIYLAGEIFPNDIDQAKTLAFLVQNDIYDIIVGSRLKTAELLQHLETPGKLEDVRYLLNNPAVSTATEDASYKNLISIYSVKPGSGKSFLAYNLAFAIAMYGQAKSNGKRPRVALIEGDLSSLSVGALLHKSNDKYNLVRALKIASEVVDAKGNKVGSKEAIQIANNEIRKCFIQHPKCKNLFALSAQSMSLSDRIAVNPHQYMFMLECIRPAFDVIIADMNSSMEHQTTGPLFAKSGVIYFLIDPDINNIKNNVRYQKDLKSIKVDTKAKYVLNKYLSPDQQQDFAEDLEYGMNEIKATGINISGVIPYIDPILMNNRAMQGEPIVADNSPATKDARNAILRIANEIWKIDMSLVANSGKQTTNDNRNQTGSVVTGTKAVAKEATKQATGLFEKIKKLLHIKSS